MDRITLAIGLVLYQADLNLLRKSLLGFKHQTTNSININIELGIIDNERGNQVNAVTDIAQELNLRLSILDKAENPGFGAGHNRLFRQFIKTNIDFDYYLCVNPDGIPHHQMIEKLVCFAQSQQNKGIFEARQFPVEHPKVYDPKSFITNWCSGCCLLFPKFIYEELDGFDESFFLYCEDVDISWRTQLLGYKCFTVPDALFHHYVFYDSRNLANQGINMNVSMYKLAVKYQVQEVANQTFFVLKQLINEKDLQKLRDFKPDSIKLEKLPDYIDFTRGGYFAENRW